MKEATLFTQEEDGRFQCHVCPRECRLKEGQRGLCFVRKVEDGKPVLTTYGRSSGFCIDPIEKKPLYHFLPGSPIFSFGTAGCNLTCSFCQNSDISKVRRMDRLNDEASPADIAETAKRQGCKSVAFTYNEPLIFLEYAVDTAEECRKRGLKSVAVTAGYATEEGCAAFFPYMDAANVDLKGFTDDFYKHFCGAELKPVLDTLVYIREKTDCWLEVTTLLIPGANDSAKDIHAMTRWIKDNLGAETPLHFSAFHPAYKEMNRPSTPAQTLFTARNIAFENGLKHVYTGNIRDTEGSLTRCAECKTALIGRDGYRITENVLTPDGLCPNCNTPLAGVFEGDHDSFGNKRTPVRFT